MPLLVVPFLLACGNKGGETKVTEDEFYNALSFEGVDYLQVRLAVADKQGKIIEEEGYRDYIYAPNAFSFYDMELEGDELKLSFEYRYFKKEGPTYIGYHQVPPSTPWHTVEADEDNIKTPVNDVAVECRYLYDQGYRYKDYKYNSSKKAYCISVKDPDAGDISVNLYFKNKKLVTLENTGDVEAMGLMEKFTYTYDKKEIEEPTIPSLE